MKQLNKLSRLLLTVALFTFISSCNNKQIGGNQSTVTKPDISEKQAKEVAIKFSKLQFLSDHPKSLESISKQPYDKAKIPGFQPKQIDKIIQVPDENNNIIMYIVKFRPAGFTIVSASKKVSPILAYSDHARFNVNNISPALERWFYVNKNIIQFHRNNKKTFVTQQIKDLWKLYFPAYDKSDVRTKSLNGCDISIQEISRYLKGPLLQTLWSQGYGYNYSLAPMGCSGDGKPPVGCTITGISQVMRYHQSPNSYNWSLMPNQILLVAINDSIEEVSRLMKDVGSAANVSYTCSSSVAYLNDGRRALINTFGYSSSMKYRKYNRQKAIDEIKANRPVLFEGYHTKKKKGWWIFKRTVFEDGHVWVCDGYDKRKYRGIAACRAITITTNVDGPDYLHMNWGWGGTGMQAADNFGWFINNDIETNVNTPKGKGYNFKHKRKMLIGIKP